MTQIILLTIAWPNYTWWWILIVVSAFVFYRVDKKNRRIYETWAGVTLLVVTLLFIGDVWFQTIWPLSWPPEHIEYGDKLVNLPNYLVFLGTAISAYFIYRTLNNQRRANQVAAFENRFFKFIDYHRTNVEEMRYKDPKDKEGKMYFEGNQVFTVIYYEMRDMLLALLDARPDKKVPITKEEKQGLIDFVYQCVFYGATKDGRPVLEKNFPTDHWEVYFSGIDFWGKPAAYSHSDQEEAPKYYSGHIRRLGHYFRNIYQAVTYVDGQDFLTEREKYDYIRILRAQMSLYEQLVFFFSSLSKLGQSWELEIYNYDLPVGRKGRARILGKLWITKYDLLRNLFNSDGVLLKDLSVMEFYPLVTMERKDECSVYGPLPFREGGLTICRYCFNERYIGYPNADMEAAIDKAFEADQGQFRSFECAEDCPTMDRVEWLRGDMRSFEYWCRGALRRRLPTRKWLINWVGAFGNSVARMLLLDRMLGRGRQIRQAQRRK